MWDHTVGGLGVAPMMEANAIFLLSDGVESLAPAAMFEYLAAGLGRE